jgi:hypothetical protein
MSTATYLLVPADLDAPMQELTLEVPSDLEKNIGCLTTLLQDYYRRTAGAFTQQGKDAMIDSVKQRSPRARPSTSSRSSRRRSTLAMSVSTCTSTTRA